MLEKESDLMAEVSSTSSEPYGERLLRSAPTSASTQGRPGEKPILDADTSPRETTQQVAKLAARLNASAVTEKERHALLAERARLLEKTLTGKLTRKEEIHLEYVRWSLDRIEDAKSGPAMDRLEAQIDEFRRLAAQLLGLRDDLEGLSKGKKHR